MKLKVMTWNIHGSASLGWSNKHEIKSKVVDKIIEQKADIFALTEFVVAKGIDYLFERFQNEGYIWFLSSRSGKNGILIGVKEALVVDKKNLLEEIYTNDLISSVDEGCNILRVTLPLRCGVNLSVIGCRMETGGEESFQEQYNAEGECFHNIVIPMIQTQKKGHDYIIVCGDFNNALCRGELNERFNPDNYNEFAQVNYNLNIIKDSFDDMGFTMADVSEKGKPIPTRGGIPLDHIFMYGFSCSKLEPLVKADGLSDHDILIAELNAPIEGKKEFEIHA